MARQLQGRRVAGSQGRRVAGIAISLLCSVGVFFLVGEVATRQLRLIDWLNGFPRNLYVAIDDEELPYRLNPNVTVETGSGPIRINVVGLRGAEVDPVPATNVERILVIGDSVVFGQGVADDATFPVYLEAELRERGVNAEVLNGGVPGYNNASELAFLKAFGLSLQPSRVLVGISLNDFGDTPVISQTGVLTQDRSERMDPDRILPESEFLLLLDWLATYAAGGHWFQAGTTNVKRERIVEATENLISNNHRRFYRDPSGPGWERARKAVKGIRDVCTAHGIGLEFVIFPEKFQSGGKETYPQRAWMELCLDLRVRCIDLLPAFETAGGDLYLGAQHHTPAGLQVAAKEVARQLRLGSVEDEITR